MGVQTEITRLQTARNKLRTKAVSLGIGLATDNLTQLATKYDGIKNKGNPQIELSAGESYTIEPGYYQGGTVSDSGQIKTYSFEDYYINWQSGRYATITGYSSDLIGKTVLMMRKAKGGGYSWQYGTVTSGAEIVSEWTTMFNPGTVGARFCLAKITGSTISWDNGGVTADGSQYISLVYLK